MTIPSFKAFTKLNLETFNQNSSRPNNMNHLPKDLRTYQINNYSLKNPSLENFNRPIENKEVNLQDQENSCYQNTNPNNSIKDIDHRGPRQFNKSFGSFCKSLSQEKINENSQPNLKQKEKLSQNSEQSNIASEFFLRNKIFETKSSGANKNIKFKRYSVSGSQSSRAMNEPEHKVFDEKIRVTTENYCNREINEDPLTSRKMSQDSYSRNLSLALNRIAVRGFPLEGKENRNLDLCEDGLNSNSGVTIPSHATISNRIKQYIPINLGKSMKLQSADSTFTQNTSDYMNIKHKSQTISLDKNIADNVQTKKGHEVPMIAERNTFKKLIENIKSDPDIGNNDNNDKRKVFSLTTREINKEKTLEICSLSNRSKSARKTEEVFRYPQTQIHGKILNQDGEAPVEGNLNIDNDKFKYIEYVDIGSNNLTSQRRCDLYPINADNTKSSEIRAVESHPQIDCESDIERLNNSKERSFISPLSGPIIELDNIVKEKKAFQKPFENKNIILDSFLEARIEKAPLNSDWETLNRTKETSQEMRETFTLNTTRDFQSSFGKSSFEAFCSQNSDRPSHSGKMRKIVFKSKSLAQRKNSQGVFIAIQEPSVGNISNNAGQNNQIQNLKEGKGKVICTWFPQVPIRGLSEPPTKATDQTKCASSFTQETVDWDLTPEESLASHLKEKSDLKILPLSELSSQDKTPRDRRNEGLNKFKVSGALKKIGESEGLISVKNSTGFVNFTKKQEAHLTIGVPNKENQLRETFQNRGTHDKENKPMGNKEPPKSNQEVKTTTKSIRMRTELTGYKNKLPDFDFENEKRLALEGLFPKESSNYFSKTYQGSIFNSNEVAKTERLETISKEIKSLRPYFENATRPIKLISSCQEKKEGSVYDGSATNKGMHSINVEDHERMTRKKEYSVRSKSFSTTDGISNEGTIKASNEEGKPKALKLTQQISKCFEKYDGTKFAF